jgi:hypothetical protein
MAKRLKARRKEGEMGTNGIVYMVIDPV